MITFTALGKTVLLVMACNANDVCTDFYEAEAWVGEESYQHCTDWVDGPEFQPRDHMKPTDDYIVVRCEGNKPEARSM